MPAQKAQKKNKDPCKGCVWLLWSGDKKALCLFPTCKREEYRKLWQRRKNGSGEEQNQGD